MRQAVAGQNDWRFLYLSSRKERKRRKVCSAVLRGRYHRPCSSGRCRGKAYHEKFRRCDREGKKSWRTKHAYFPWRPSGTPLPQNREGGHLLCRCPPFGTPDQTLTGGLPLRSMLTRILCRILRKIRNPAIPWNPRDCRILLLKSSFWGIQTVKYF